MKVFYDKVKSAELNERLVDKWSEINRYGGDKDHPMEEHEPTKHGDEMHVYDIVYCPMKKINKLLGIKVKYTKISVGVMFIGIVAQKLIQWLYSPKEREYRSIIPHLVEGHIDVYEGLRYPIEIKSTRKRIFKADQMPKEWKDQIAVYLAMENKIKGWIVIVNVVTCQIAAFCVSLNNREVDDIRDEIERRIENIDYLWNTKDFTEAEIHPEDYEYCRFKRQCARKKDCSKIFNSMKRKKLTK